MRRSLKNYADNLSAKGTAQPAQRQGGAWVASVVGHLHGNNPVITPFIMVFTAVLAFFASCV
jgi:hypothetical protein